MQMRQGRARTDVRLVDARVIDYQRVRQDPTVPHPPQQQVDALKMTSNRAGSRGSPFQVARPTKSHECDRMRGGSSLHRGSGGGGGGGGRTCQGHRRQRHRPPDPFPARADRRNDSRCSRWTALQLVLPRCNGVVRVATGGSTSRSERNPSTRCNIRARFGVSHLRFGRERSFNGTLRYSLLCGTLRCSAVLCSTLRYSAVLFTLRCSAVLFTLQYSRVLCGRHLPNDLAAAELAFLAIPASAQNTLIPTVSTLTSITGTLIPISAGCSHSHQHTPLFRVSARPATHAASGERAARRVGRTG